MKRFHPPLDDGIKKYVTVLRKAGIETFNSCEGGKGHSCAQPTVLFHGDYLEGHRAMGIALQHDLPVASVARIWTNIDGEPTGPEWQMVFWKKAGTQRQR